MLLYGKLKLSSLHYFDNTVKHQPCFKCRNSDLKAFFHVKICNNKHYVWSISLEIKHRHFWIYSHGSYANNLTETFLQNTLQFRLRFRTQCRAQTTRLCFSAQKSDSVLWIGSCEQLVSMSRWAVKIDRFELNMFKKYCSRQWDSRPI